MVVMYRSFRDVFPGLRPSLMIQTLPIRRENIPKACPNVVTIQRIRETNSIDNQKFIKHNSYEDNEKAFIFCGS